MFATKLKAGLAAIVMLGMGAFTYGMLPAGKMDEPPAKPDAEPKEPVDPTLLKARIGIAEMACRQAYNGLGTLRRTGDIVVSQVKPNEAYTWYIRLLNAQLEMMDKKKDRIAAIEDNISRLKEVHRRVDTMVPSFLPQIDLHGAGWTIAEAEVQLAKEKAQPPSQRIDPALLKARLDIAKEAYKLAYEGLGTVKRFGNTVVCLPDEGYTWSVRLLNSQLEMVDKKDERIAALEDHVKRTKDLKKKMEDLDPRIPKIEIRVTRWNLAEAEFWLAKEKASQASQRIDPALLKARLDIAKEGFEDAYDCLGAFKRVNDAQIPVCIPSDVYAWSTHWLDAQLDMTDKKDERIAAIQEHFNRLKESQKKLDPDLMKMDPSLIPVLEERAAKWYLAVAEIRLAKEKAK